MSARERRRTQETDDAALRAALNPAQLDALQTLEAFQWRLRFVRRPAFLDPVPVVVDRAGTRHAVLEGDGSINDAPGFAIRD